MASREAILLQELEAAKMREAALVQDREAAKMREAALVQKVTTLQMELKVAKQIELKTNENANHLQVQILALRSNIARIVSAILKVVHDFMEDLKEFHLANLQDFDKNSAPAKSCNFSNPLCNSKHASELVPWESVTTCLQTLCGVTECARSGLTQASKDWKDAQERVSALTQKARDCMLQTILGKRHTYTMEFANPKAIDFRIEPHPLETQLGTLTHKKFKNIPAPGTGQQTNQNKPEASTSSFGGSSSSDGVRRNLDT